ncbi:hypothetical protein BV22DRAFT_1106280 [Leucogyrophana mollusca]|uniref:Uncharacterized protein n=1 Tax=Leucogyrophana mollusca TaxID=85980 RepID=A0ACB8BCW6_9AGAM|nr:hypothetical protein BV22DRAFT_1106280 [Leucogyrophana mollusca]
MASSTQDQSSTTSDLATNPTSSPSSNVNDPNGVDIFTSNGSPPLIVAFLAIGLFMVAMAAVFGWRRVNGNRGLLVHQVRAARPGKKPVVLGEKPVLWDMWTRRAASTAIEDVRWENVMPFSAVLHCPVEPPIPSPPIKPLDPPPLPPPAPNRLAQTVTALQHYFRPLPPLSTTSRPDNSLSPASPREGITLSEGAWVQVCVTIAMPSQVDRQPSSSCNFAEEELLEYCIGTVDVPWSEDDG